MPLFLCPRQIYVRRSDQMDCEISFRSDGLWDQLRGSYRIFRASSERKMAARTHTMLFVVRVVGEHQHLFMHAHLYVWRVSLAIRYTLHHGSSQMKRYLPFQKRSWETEGDCVSCVLGVSLGPPSLASDPMRTKLYAARYFDNPTVQLFGFEMVPGFFWKEGNIFSGRW